MGRKEERRAFLRYFREHLSIRNPEIVLAGQVHAHYQNFRIGIRACHLAAVCLIRNKDGEQELRAEFVAETPRVFAKYNTPAIRGAIRNELPEITQWPIDKKNTKLRRVEIKRAKIDLRQHDKWPEYCKWICGKLDRLYEVFNKYTQNK